MMARKRGYSREFRPQPDSGKRYLLDAIPAELWSAVRAKARRDGVSLRALILHLVTLWLNGTVALPPRSHIPDKSRKFERRKTSTEGQANADIEVGEGCPHRA